MTISPRDYAGCDNEVLVKSTRIQASSKLIVICPTSLSIVAASANFLTPNTKTAWDVFEESTISDLIAGASSFERPASRALRAKDGNDYWASFFWSGTNLCCELIPDNLSASSARELTDAYSRSVERVTKRKSLALKGAPNIASDYLNAAVEEIRSFTGYDRVMVYKFDAEWNGEVVGETKGVAAQHSFLGLRFPSGDIPRPARELFLKNRVRIIGDVNREDIEIASYGDACQPYAIHAVECTGRHVSDVHRQYLKNMKVTATLVHAIIVSGRLWGLITCHHYSGPRHPSPLMTSLTRALVEIIASHLLSIRNAEKKRVTDHVDALLQLKLDECRREENVTFKDWFSRVATEVTADLGLSHIVFRSEKVDFTLERERSPKLVDKFERLSSRWMRQYSKYCFVTSEVEQSFPDLAFASNAPAGAYHQKSIDGHHQLFLFRPPSKRASTWAGDPQKQAENTSSTDERTLNPRASFEAYQDQTANKSRDWTETDQDYCAALFDGLRNRYFEFLQIELSRRIIEQLQETERLATRDALTGLYNRRSFKSQLTKLQKQAVQDQKASGWLILLDLDDFKRLNDRHGHQAGDMGLMHVSRALSTLEPPLSAVSRLGGDEFAALLDRSLGVRDPAKICRKLIDAVGTELEVNGQAIRLGCSIGIAEISDAYVTPEDLMHLADVAMYEAKKHKVSEAVVCTPDLVLKTNMQAEGMAAVEKALLEDQFVPFYQPIFSSLGHEIESFEVLARWEHPEHGTLAPSHFMQHLKNAKLTAELDRIILEKCLADRQHWRYETGFFPALSVNVSPERLHQSTEWLTAIEDPSSRKNLRFELLETIFFDSLDSGLESLIEILREQNIKIALDDFGSGHSSFLAITSLRPETLKIDRRLISPIASNAAAFNLLGSITQIASDLGIETVAEGVETKIIQSKCVEAGCDFLQGFHLGRPSRAAQAQAMLVGMQDG